MPRISMLTLAIAYCLASAVSAAEPVIDYVAKADKEHVRCSEGTTLELLDGTLLLIYQEMDEGEGDSDFFPSRLAAQSSRDGGRTWSGRRVVAENEPGYANIMSPSLLRLPEREILLTFLRNHTFDKKKNVYPPISGFAWISTDEGQTFRPLATLWTEQMLSLCNNTLKRLSTGRIVLTVNREASQPGQKDHWQAGVIFSDDNGRTWKLSDSWVDAPKRGAMEPHVAERKDGSLLMVMRTQAGNLYRSESADGGLTWSQGEPLSVESPESCPELLSIPGGDDLLLIWNASKYDPKWASHFGKRTPLSTAISRDGGRTWSRPRQIETDPGRAFSNPGGYFTSQGNLILNYWTCQYQANGSMSNFPIDLKVAVVEKKWLYGE